MKDKRLVAVWVAVVAIMFVVMIIFVPRVFKRKLDPPSNVRFSGYVFEWAANPDADGYEVEVDGEIRTAENSRIFLKYADHGKYVRVRCITDSPRRESSDFTQLYHINFSEQTLYGGEYVSYYYPNGSKKEFIYDGLSVYLSPPEDLAYGYEFKYWYLEGDGEMTPITDGLVTDKSITLYAKTSLIEYPLEYEFSSFDRPKELPDFYTVESFYDLFDMRFESQGYEVVGWSVKGFKGEQVSPEEVNGGMTLVADVRLKNDGLSLTECEGGYAVSGYTGNEQTVYIPAEFNGERVVKILDGAFKGEDFAIVQRVVCYGDILVESGAFSCTGETLNMEFLGSAEIETDSFNLMEYTSLNLFVHGTPNVKTAFFAYYLDILPSTPKVTVFVKEQFVPSVEQIDGMKIDILS